jgi:hypothetical protein
MFARDILFPISCIDYNIMTLSREPRLWNSMFIFKLWGYKPFKVQWLLYVPLSLTYQNSKFCPQSVFVCFVWFSELTATVSLNSINRLVFVAET